MKAALEFGVAVCVIGWLAMYFVYPNVGHIWLIALVQLVGLVIYAVFFIHKLFRGG